MNKTLNIASQMLSKRIQKVPRSFIRDILSVTNQPDIISFAGGLPNKLYFPVDELAHCAQKVLVNHGQEALQYSTTEGLLNLREQICEQYQKQGLQVMPNRILITSGSQQALDLIGKVFINPGDNVLLEEPAYLGAIQAFSMYQPDFTCIPLQNNGINTNILAHTLLSNSFKLAYLVPNFQNPSGISYTDECRKEVAELAIDNSLLVVEDDPYGSICFTDSKPKSLAYYAPSNTLLLGTFSKTVAPGFRIGWIVAPTDEIYNKLVTAKQASDLHSDIFSQRVISTYLQDYNLGIHLQKIIKAYKHQSEVMLNAIAGLFPKTASFTSPKGGMFCWVDMGKGFSSMELFKRAIDKKVAFVPGVPFYINKNDTSTFRLNFSCSTPDEIKKGIFRLSKAINAII